MRADIENKANDPVMLTGEVARIPSWKPVRVLLIMSGLILVRNVLALIARYCLGLRGRSVASVKDNTVTLTAEWTLFGRRFHRSKTTVPIRDLSVVRFENRQRYLYLLVAFGALATGTLVGMQWFLDGLRAGYPYLVLVGAAVVAAGVVVDALLFIFVPKGAGKSHLVLVLGPWIVRLVGVDPVKAEAFLNAVHAGWKR
jgi:hypothetical protein